MTLAGTAVITIAAMLPRPIAAALPQRSQRAAPLTRRSQRAASLARRRQRWWLRLLPAALAGWYGVNYGMTQVRAIDEPSAGNVRAAVGAGITGLPALQGALIARTGAPGSAVAVAVAAPVGRHLAKRFSPT